MPRIVIYMVGIVVVLILLSRCQQEHAQAIETYPTVAACRAQHDEAECERAMAGAQAQQDQTAPHYGNQATCEDVYGPGNCVPRGEYAPPGYYPGGYGGSGGWFVPAMVGFMIGHALSSGPVYQPVYLDRRGYAYSGSTLLGAYGGGGGGSGYVYRTGGSSASVWQSGQYATRTVTPSRGGFGGSIAKPFAADSGSHAMALGSSVSRGGFGSSARGFGGG
jgi:uncharacterized protein YgiB involved in biofilm formation